MNAKFGTPHEKWSRKNPIVDLGPYEIFIERDERSQCWSRLFSVNFHVFPSTLSRFRAIPYKRTKGETNARRSIFEKGETRAAKKDKTLTEECGARWKCSLKLGLMVQMGPFP